MVPLAPFNPPYPSWQNLRRSPPSSLSCKSVLFLLPDSSKALLAVYRSQSTNLVKATGPAKFLGAMWRTTAKTSTTGASFSLISNMSAEQGYPTSVPSTPCDQEKDDVVMTGERDVEGSVSTGAPACGPASGADARARFTEKLCLKLDWHILTPMFFLNFLSLMGRTNIGAALIQDLPEDLHLNAMKVFLVIAMPLIMLILFEVPSNLLMKWLDARFGLCYMRYMSLITAGLGASSSDETLFAQARGCETC